MATIKATIDSRHSKKKDGYQILIRVQHTLNKKEDIPLGLYLKNRKDFDIKGGRVKTRKNINYEELNEIINTKLLYYKKRFKGNQKTTTLRAKEDVLQEFERLINKLEAEGKYNSKRIISYAFKYLKDFLNSNNKNSLLVDEIDDVFLDDYKVFLINSNLKSGTIKAYIEKLRTVHNLLITRLNIIKINPFKNFRIEKEETKNTLTLEFFNKFINYIPVSKERIFYKQMFLSMFYLQGSRVSDLLTLTYDKLLVNGLINENEIDKYSSTSVLISYGLQKSNKIDFSTVSFTLDFKAFKTAQNHIIPLSNKAILQLRFFLDTDLQLEYLNGSMADKELRVYLGKEIEKSYLFTEEEKVKRLKELIIIQKKRTPNKPIFHNFNIDGLKGNDLRLFVQSKTTYINKSLKSNESEDYYKTYIKTHISCHCARHLFSIFYYEKKRDIFGLSKLLFHSKVQTTQDYLKRLNVRVHTEIDAFEFYDNL